MAARTEGTRDGGEESGVDSACARGGFRAARDDWRGDESIQVLRCGSGHQGIPGSGASGAGVAKDAGPRMMLLTRAVSVEPAPLPVLVAAEPHAAQLRFMEFFASNIRNAHTRRAYARAASSFLGWCERLGVRSLGTIQPLHVAAWI